MNALDIPKTHVIVTYSGTKHWITREQNEKLKGVGDKDYIEIEGSSIRGSSIAGIFTLQDYYNAHPEERPADTRVFTAPDKLYVPLDKLAERSQYRMNSLVEGLKAYCSTSESGPNSKAILAKAEKRYAELYGNAKPALKLVSTIDAWSDPF